MAPNAMSSGTPLAARSRRTRKRRAEGKGFGILTASLECRQKLIDKELFVAKTGDERQIDVLRLTGFPQRWTASPPMKQNFHRLRNRTFATRSRLQEWNSSRPEKNGLLFNQAGCF